MSVKVERDVKIGKVSKVDYVQQAVEILTALKKLGERLKPEEESFLEMNSSASLRQFERVTGELGRFES